MTVELICGMCETRPVRFRRDRVRASLCLECTRAADALRKFWADEDLPIRATRGSDRRPYLLPIRRTVAA